jgi:hypothetical protein
VRRGAKLARSSRSGQGFSRGIGNVLAKPEDRRNRFPFDSGDLKNPSLPPGCQGLSTSGSFRMKPASLAKHFSFTQVVREGMVSFQEKNRDSGIAGFQNGEFVLKRLNGSAGASH